LHSQRFPEKVPVVIFAHCRQKAVLERKKKPVRIMDNDKVICWAGYDEYVTKEFFINNNPCEPPFLHRRAMVSIGCHHADVVI